MNRKLPFQIVDVFAQEKYAGNQLAVFTDASGIGSVEMAAIARETNFSETTFVTAVNIEKKEAEVRIFTPGGEIPFAGHPTLGTARVVNNVFFGGKLDEVVLNLEVGKIPVQLKGDVLWMKQIQPSFGEITHVSEIEPILNIKEKDFVQDFPIQVVSTGLPFYVAALNNINALKNIRLNVSLAQDWFSDAPAKGLLVFALNKQSADIDIRSRVFVPMLGIPEDPATGSATGCLAAYILKHNLINSDNISLLVEQGTEIQRRSILHIEAGLNNGVYSIEIGGEVVDIAEGSWQ